MNKSVQTKPRSFPLDLHFENTTVEINVFVCGYGKQPKMQKKKGIDRVKFISFGFNNFCLFVHILYYTSSHRPTFKVIALGDCYEGIIHIPYCFITRK